MTRVIQLDFSWQHEVQCIASNDTTNVKSLISHESYNKQYHFYWAQSDTGGTSGTGRLRQREFNMLENTIGPLSVTYTDLLVVSGFGIKM